MTKLSETLLALRKRKGMSQAEVAEALGVSRSSIGMYETAAREPELKMLEAFAALYGVDMNTLTGNVPDRSAEEEILQALHDTPGLRIMFDISKDRSAEDVAQAAEIIRAFYRTKDGPIE